MPTMKHDPDAVLDYGIDWKPWLVSGDTITTSSWEISEGDGALAIDSEFSDSHVAGVWLSGGNNGVKYKVTNHIMTAAGREDDRSLTILVQER